MMVHRFLLTAATFAFALPAIAQEIDPEDRDAAAVAQMRGISVAEAKKQANLDRQVAQLAERLAKNPNFVGLRIVRVGATYRVHASFKRGNKPAKDSLGATGDLAPVVDTAEGTYTIAEQEETRSAVLAALPSQSVRFNVFPDPDTGLIIVETDNVEKAQRSLANLGSKVEVRSAPGFLAQTVALQGGQTVTFTRTNGAAGGNGSSAFGVKSSTGSGILTNGHGLIAFNGTWSVASPGGLSTQGVTLQVKGALNDATRDLSWGQNPNATANTVSNRIFDGQGQRAITSGATSLPANGTTICKYGISTGYQCGTVENNNFTGSNGGQPVGPMILVGGTAATIQKCGDSGGPLFVGAIAYGVASATIDNGVDPTCAQGSKVVYTPISRIAGLGLSLITQ